MVKREGDFQIKMDNKCKGDGRSERQEIVNMEGGR